MTFKLKLRWFLVGGILLVALGAGAASEVFLPRLFVVPHRTHYDPAAPGDTPAKFGLGFTAFDIKTDDHLILKGWFVSATGRPAAGTVIILHGWCGSKEWIRPLIQLVVESGYNAIAYDSRAHGASGGQCCTYGVKEKDDVGAVLSQAQKQFGDIGPVGILGVSYGAAVTTQALAHEPRLRCGVIISSFSRLEDVARVQMHLLTRCDNDWLFHRVLAKGEAIGGFKVADVQPTEAARRITQPVLVIHGEHDNLVPIADAHLLFEHIPSQDKEWYAAEHGDHDHILGCQDTPEINARIVRFLGQWMPAPVAR